MHASTFDDLGAFGQGIFDVLMNLGDRLAIDQRPKGHSVGKTIADLQRSDRCSQLVDESVIHLVVHVQAVGTDAGLPSVTEFRCQRALYRRVEISIIEHDEGCITPNSKEIFLMSWAHFSMISRPISVEPVNEILRTIGLLVSSSAISAAAPAPRTTHPEVFRPARPDRPRPGPRTVSAKRV